MLAFFIPNKRSRSSQYYIETWPSQCVVCVTQVAKYPPSSAEELKQAQQHWPVSYTPPQDKGSFENAAASSPAGPDVLRRFKRLAMAASPLISSRLVQGRLSFLRLRRSRCKASCAKPLTWSALLHQIFLLS
jgi:hypothetical protein